MAEQRSLKSFVTGSIPVWGAIFKCLVSSPAERQSLKLCAVGSTPIRGSIFRASSSETVEHIAERLWVGGSIPSLPATGCDIRSACSLGLSPSTTANGQRCRLSAPRSKTSADHQFRPSSSVGQEAGQNRVFPIHMQPAGRRVRRGKGMSVRILMRSDRKSTGCNKPGVGGSSPSLGTNLVE